MNNLLTDLTGLTGSKTSADSKGKVESDPHCETRVIMGFGQSISRRNFLPFGSDPMGFKGQPGWGDEGGRGGGKVTGLAGRVQEVAAHSTACNEYHGRQSKHDTSSSRSGAHSSANTAQSPGRRFL